jgi:hypothetical protein
MTSKASRGLLCSTGLLAVGLLACNDRRPGSPVAPLPPGATPAITRIEIAGPASVPPGEAVQFSATARLSDGSSRDVTTEARWNSSKPAVVSVSPGGRVTGHETGEAMVSASVGSAAGTREVIVVPRSTFRIVGLVTEADAASAPVVAARVAVTAGLGAGLFATTGEDGRYRLYGVAGDVELRITKDGYQPHGQRYQVADHLMLNAQLNLLAPRPDVAGTFTLTIAAAEECRATMPEEVRLRNYTAVLTQNGSQLRVRLQDATFAVAVSGKGNGFSGRAEPTQVVFNLSRFDASYYGYYGGAYGDLVEQLADARYLIVAGLARATDSGAGLSGSLDGSLTVFTGKLKSFPAVEVACSSANHRFTLRR